MSLYKDEITQDYTDLAVTDLGCFDDNLSRIRRVPVALHVCQESRRHTLKRYRAIKHNANKDARVYVDPCRDLLWSDAVLIDELQVLINHGRCYERQLAHIEMLFVEEEEWKVYNESNTTLKQLILFTGLKLIVVLLEDDIETGLGETNAANDRNDRDGGSEQSGDTEVENAEEDMKLRLAYPGLHQRANKLRTEFSELLSGQEVPKRIYCVDKSGTFH